MNPRFLIEQFTKAMQTMQAQVEELKARVKALEDKPRPGRPPKVQADTAGEPD
jgi:cell division protein FtsB